MLSSKQNNKRDKRALVIGALLILCVGVYYISKSFIRTDSLFTASSEEPVVSKETEVPLMAPNVLLKKIQNGDKVTIVDIRSETSFESGHIAHALSVPIGSLQNFSPNKDEAVVIVFSEEDLETFEAAKNILATKSFPYFFLKGGFAGWTNLGAPSLSIGDPNSFMDQSKVTYIELEAFKKFFNEKNPSLFILDVQAEENYKKKHIQGATNIPLDQLENRVHEIPAGRQIVVYGENDVFSFQGGVRLLDLGIFTARTLTGNKYLSPSSGLPLEP
jgi:rhodanese-related sulfurtransferase